MKLVDGNDNGNKKNSLLGMLFQGAIFYVFMAVLVVGIALGFKIYAQEKDVSVITEGITDVRLGDTVKLKFSTRMLQRSVEESMTIEPELKVKTVWEDATVLGIIPLESPAPETTYLIKISGAKTQFYIPQKEISKEFASPAFPRLKAVYPADNQKDVDIFDHITVDFDRTLEAPFNVEVKITPMTTGFQHTFNEAKTQLVITPAPKMDKKTEYTVVVTLRHNHLASSREVYSGKFTTKPPPPVIYSYRGNNQKIKTEERLEEIEPRILEGRYIDIDLSSQTMFIFEDGKEKGAFKVSTGMRGMDTPRGTFKVMGKSRRPWSQKYKLYMPWFIQFTTQGHGIHELPEWPNGYKEGTNHLGIPVSHGCVRLGIGPAKTVYDFANIGIPVVVHR